MTTEAGRRHLDEFFTFDGDERKDAAGDVAAIEAEVSRATRDAIEAAVRGMYNEAEGTGMYSPDYFGALHSVLAVIQEQRERGAP
jgi:hypothetical protein